MVNVIKRTLGFKKKETKSNGTISSKESKKGSVFAPKPNIEETIITCDCCQSEKITMKVIESFSDSVSKDVPVSRQESFINGELYDGVAICKHCVDSCTNEIEEELMILKGELNVLKSYKDESTALLDKTKASVKAIRKEAADSISKIEKETSAKIALTVEEIRACEEDIYAANNEISIRNSRRMELLTEMEF